MVHHRLRSHPGCSRVDPTSGTPRAPGVTDAVPVTDASVFVQVDPDHTEAWDGQYVHGPDLQHVTHLPVVEGSLADLTGTDTVAMPEGPWEIGTEVDLWLSDSTPMRLRVVATLANHIDRTVLLPWALRDTHTAKPLADAVYLNLSPDARLGPVRAAAAPGGGEVTSTDDFLSDASAEEDRNGRLIVIALLGMSLTYSGIAIANTLIMATGGRARELATLRLSGQPRAR
jgi:putative ABC transport system permease protein